MKSKKTQGGTNGCRTASERLKIEQAPDFFGPQVFGKIMGIAEKKSVCAGKFARISGSKDREEVNHFKGSVFGVVCEKLGRKIKNPVRPGGEREHEKRQVLFVKIIPHPSRFLNLLSAADREQANAKLKAIQTSNPGTYFNSLAFWYRQTRHPAVKAELENFFRGVAAGGY